MLHSDWSSPLFRPMIKDSKSPNWNLLDLSNIVADGTERFVVSIQSWETSASNFSGSLEYVSFQFRLWLVPILRPFSKRHLLTVSLTITLTLIENATFQVAQFHKIYLRGLIFPHLPLRYCICLRLMGAVQITAISMIGMADRSMTIIVSHLNDKNIELNQTLYSPLF